MPSLKKWANWGLIYKDFKLSDLLEKKEVEQLIDLYDVIADKHRIVIDFAVLSKYPITKETLSSFLTCYYGVNDQKELQKTLSFLGMKDFFGDTFNIYRPKVAISPQLHHYVLMRLDKSLKKNKILTAFENVIKEYTSGKFKKDSFYEKYCSYDEKIAQFAHAQFTMALYFSNDHKKLINFQEQLGSEVCLNVLSDLVKDVSLSQGWLKEKPLFIQEYIMTIKLTRSFVEGTSQDTFSNILPYYESIREQSPQVNALMFYQAVLSGQADIVNAYTLKDNDPSVMWVVKGIAYAITNQSEKALDSFNEAIRFFKKTTKKRKLLLSVPETIFKFLLLIKQKADDMTFQGHINDERSRSLSLASIFQTLIDFHNGFLSDNWLSADDWLITEKHYNENSPMVYALIGLIGVWTEKIIVVQKNTPAFRDLFTIHKKLFPFVAKIFAEVLKKYALGTKETDLFLKENEHIPSMMDFLTFAPKWERQLNALDFVVSGIESNQLEPELKTPETILCFYLNPETIRVSITEQKFSEKTGKPLKEKDISIEYLFNNQHNLTYLTPEDKKIIASIKKEGSSRWSNNEYYIQRSEFLLALVNHPRVFHVAQRDMRLHFIHVFPELLVEDAGHNMYHVKLSVFSSEETVLLEKETPTLYRVIEFSKTWLPIAKVLGQDGMMIPKDKVESTEKLTKILKTAKTIVPVQSVIDVEDSESIEGDSTPYFHIFPLDQGLEINGYVRPFKDNGPYVRPGQGNSSVALKIDEKSIRAKRDFSLEKERMKKAINQSVRLKRDQDGSYSWAFSDPEESLEVLDELQQIQDKEDIAIEWPKGQKLTLSKRISSKNISLNIKEKADWFHFDGEIQIDDQVVINFKDLLDRLEGSRFIALDEKNYLCLTDHLKKQLQELKAFSDRKEGSIHKFGSFALEHLATEVGSLKVDKKWKETIKKMKDAEKSVPQLPRTLMADLRAYQKEGFEWISRLMAQGMGACLADDMGLGKTLQAISVMITKADKGPCLVIAPTSVCHNWVLEIKKFAPTLNPYLMSDILDADKRAEMINTLDHLDVMICSYTMLQQEEDLFASKTWEMIVVDEAQAIKNATTKRFKAIEKLSGNNRLALTGTPIENHAEDIWSLFQFMVPGLLGSIAQFRTRFLLDESGRAGLKSLMGKFILRRTKNVVLTELPARITKTVLIDMENEEIAFYEAMRQRALENLSENASGQSGQRRIHILAEMTKLRQACCHPKLAIEDSTVPSSKLRSFVRLVDDLLENNHQALVFSQYVRYLSLVREVLDQKKIPYQYLDGSTPASERKKQVQDFQEGKSPLFLLSLKAGGSGLNLTAADYVIHMDPWWNPAVEDQASDRAHRMGQTRPVTIYRLIMKNTIEEKIMALHESKRNLSAEFLDGTNVADKITEDELLDLIRRS